MKQIETCIVGSERCTLWSKQNFAQTSLTVQMKMKMLQLWSHRPEDERKSERRRCNVFCACP